MELDQPHAIDVIASGIHDIKNNLFNAQSRVGSAMQSIHDGTSAAALPLLGEVEQTIAASTERLSKLLSAYRLLRHENPVSMVPVDVPDLLEDVLIRVREGNDGGVAITSECRCDGFWVFDRELVADTLVNALQNALRFGRHRAHLLAAEVDRRLCLSVNDDGPGFPEVLPDHADGTHSGVGLYIARRIARLHVRQGQHGDLHLANGGPLGGALLQLTLP